MSIMRRSLIKMLEEFRIYWKHYIIQSLLATFVCIYCPVFSEFTEGSHNCLNRGNCFYRIHNA